MTENAVILARASTGKQVIEGDTLDDQLAECLQIIEDNKWNLTETFTLIESGRKKERAYFEKVIRFCEDELNNVQYVVFKNISRFTREGEIQYMEWKNRLKRAGVKLKDTVGVIGEEHNALARLGFSYEWSNRQPTQAAEAYEANKARDYVNEALTQMIGAEIKYTMLGYWNKPAPFGYYSQKIETTNDGKRNVLFRQENEAIFVEKIFELRKEAIKTDKEIVLELNTMGYRSRKRAIRNKKTKQVIGYGGEKKLTVKTLQEIIKRPIYAGYLREKWTHWQLVKSKFDGLVSVDVFNQANRGKVFIDESRKEPQFLINYTGSTNATNLKRLRRNPTFPYKRLFLCPICGKHPTASATPGRSKQKYPAYHCDKGHKRWSASKADVHELIDNFVARLEFEEGITKLFRASYLEVWEDKRGKAIEDSKLSANHVQELLVKQQQTLETIKVTTTSLVREQLEKDYNDLDAQIKEAREARNKLEIKENSIKEALRYATYLMEHPAELLINQRNMQMQETLFGLVFDGWPTYDQLLNGTAKLSPTFKLKQSPTLTKSDLVTPSGFEPELTG